jgi:hypothetical protein
MLCVKMRGALGTVVSCQKGIDLLGPHCQKEYNCLIIIRNTFMLDAMLLLKLCASNSMYCE